MNACHLRVNGSQNSLEGRAFHIPAPIPLHSASETAAGTPFAHGQPAIGVAVAVVKGVGLTAS